MHPRPRTALVKELHVTLGLALSCFYVNFLFWIDAHETRPPVISLHFSPSEISRFKVYKTQKQPVHVSRQVAFLVVVFVDFRTCQDYFIHFEQSRSLGRAKVGDPQEKTPDHPQAELGLSHT